MQAMTRVSSLLILTASLLLCGCATYDRAKPAPAQSQPIGVVFTDASFSDRNDLPLGAYRVPDSQIVISGQPAGSTNSLFSVTGALGQSSTNFTFGHGAVRNTELDLHLDPTSQARAILGTLIASGASPRIFTAKAAAGAPTLFVASYVVVTYVNDSDVRPYVVLQASLREPGAAAPVWTTRYIASTGAPLPMAGEHSLTANGGELFKRIASADLEEAIKVMLAEVASAHVRDDSSLTFVQGNFPFAKHPLQMTGYKVAEDQQNIAFIPKLGDANIYSGVNIMDKSVTTYRPATSDDPIFSPVAEPEQK
jgi:hypothetical protein